MSLEKAKTICRTLVESYGNNAIDIQGGEPTIYPHIYELIAYCRDIGLLPTLITNALVLDKSDTCTRFIEAGLRDCLVSVHGLGDTYDRIVGVPGAHQRQMKGIDNLCVGGIPFRFNCVLSKTALADLRGVAKLAMDSGARVVNFIAFNPFEDQQKSGKRSDENVPRYSEVGGPLTEAMDMLESAGIEANVRYYPICMVEERHRKSVYNFQQLPYDIHEWDYASWSWTGMTSQRMRDGHLSHVISLEEATIRPVEYPGPLNRLAVRVRKSLEPHPKLFDCAVRVHRSVSASVQRRRTGQRQESGKDWLYRENARIRARDHCKYVYGEDCGHCSAQAICDGFHGDYASLFGTAEAVPIEGELSASDPRHYIAEQDKVVEIEDYGWAL